VCSSVADFGATSKTSLFHFTFCVLLTPLQRGTLSAITPGPTQSLHSTFACVKVAPETVTPLKNTEAGFTASHPFLPLLEPALLLSRLRSGLLVDNSGCISAGRLVRVPQLHFWRSRIMDKKVIGSLPGQFRVSKIRPISSRFWSGDDNSAGLVAWVYPRRFPWLPCTLPTSSCGRPRCGVVPAPSASCDLEAVLGLQHLCEGKLRAHYQSQVLGSQAAVCLTLSGSTQANGC
jgi:hypothetical protein